MSRRDEILFFHSRVCVYSILLCEAPYAYALLGKRWHTLRLRACQRWMIFLYFTSRRASARKNAAGIILLLLPPIRLFIKADPSVSCVVLFFIKRQNKGVKPKILFYGLGNLLQLKYILVHTSSFFWAYRH